MERDDLIGVFLIIFIIFSILAIIGVCYYGSYVHKIAKYDNFQITINELSEEQKCLYICGFQYPTSTYFDQYKFCVEKCDRISERYTKCEIE